MTQKIQIRSGGLAVLAFVCVLAISTIVTRPVAALAGNYAWQQVTGINGGDQQTWQALSMSDNGARMAMGVYGGSIYTSNNFASTWTTTSRNWYSIDNSSDGTKLVAGVLSGYLYTSTNSGATWTERTNAGSHWWTSVAMSSDGTKLAAIGDDIIYTSANSGATWTERQTPIFRHWTSLAMNASGTKLIAVDPITDALATSLDSGVTWAEQVVPGGQNFSSVAMSSDGTKMIVGTYYGYIYTSSDSGVTWVPQVAAGARYWQSVATNSDATRIVALDYAGPLWEGGSIYVSSDSGATWTEQVTPGVNFWQSVTMNASGSRVAAAAVDGPVYIGIITNHLDTETINFNTLLSSENTTVSNASLSVVSSACPAIDTPSISVLNPTGVTSPEANVTIVGGIGFSLLCSTPGGSSDATIELGAHYTDLSDVRIYKKTTNSSVLQDITDEVRLSNKPLVGGGEATTVAYTLIDGSNYDEDQIANGTIVDPIYIGITSGADESTAMLADTGQTIFTPLFTALVLFGTAFSLVIRKQ